MRNSGYIGAILATMLFLDLLLSLFLIARHESFEKEHDILRMVASELGATDLVVSTEARYTRHPAVSDKVVPFMDHPADIEHFPSGSFFFPVDKR